jgi:2-polyprenyl-3-methyl-5-hydroxy-6-metoxy-1,4-benzoquinol methylase
METRLKQHPLGFFEIVNKPSQKELQDYYAKKYYQEAKGSYELEYSDAELLYFQAKLEQRFAVINQHLHLDKTNTKKMLDVGCGEGYALSFFNAKGWQVKGIDFSSAGVMSKNPNCKDFLDTGDVFELLDAEIAKAEKYDIVWLQNVLEHVINPIDLLKSLRQLVKPNGMAVITVPNDFSIIQQGAIKNGHIDNEFWVVYPDHLNYFDFDSLVKTATFTGWTDTEVLAGFPVDWYLFHPDSNYIRNKSAGKSAHFARVQIENLIHKKPVEDVIQFWSKMAKLGIGRDITAFLQPIK